MNAYVKKLAKKETLKHQEIMGVCDGTRVLRRREGRSVGKKLGKGGNPPESDCFHPSNGSQKQIYIPSFDI